MIKSLYGRLAWVMLSVFLVLGLVMFWVYDNATRQLQQETAQKLHLNLAQYLVDDIDLYSRGKLNTENVKQAFDKVMHIGPGTELYVISTQGKVLAYKAPREKIIKHRIDLKPVKSFIRSKAFDMIRGDDPRSDKQKVFSAAPSANSDGRLLAYLYIIIRGESYDDTAALISSGKTRLLSFVLMSVALVFLLLTTLLLFYKLTRPLARLDREITGFEESGFQHLFIAPVSAKQRDEIQSLQGSFHRMGSKIIEQLNTLRRHDQTRREFLAHVSHDLRTPLAGMRGYLETLQLNDQQFSVTERQDFIEKTLTINKKLSSMIDELFELAQLEHGEITINLERVRLSDLLSDLYATLSELANAKGVRLSIEMDTDNIQVLADVARLDRVLQNLVCNAIIYTPPAGEVIVRVTEEVSYGVQISVEDTGQGIAAEELPYVFEPYYRSASGQLANRQGNGLGLAIASRLLALHRSPLRVESDLGTGTRFIFSLPAYSSRL